MKIQKELAMNNIATKKYPLTMRILHWAMALIIVGLVCVGSYMADLPDDAVDKYALYPWHKSFGVLILILVVARLVIRKLSVIPDLPSAFSSKEKLIIKIGHGTLYLLMIATPAVGYAMSCAAGAGVKFFGIALPSVLEKNEALFENLSEVHETLAWALLIIAGLHALAAIKHMFDKNPDRHILNRMK
jgi:cytochrome b561